MSNIAEAGRQKWVPAGLLAAGLTVILAACTTVASPAPATQADTTVQTEPVSTPDNETAEPERTEPEASAPEGAVETLTFAVQESTFLSHIQNAAAEIGTPAARYYVELSGTEGVSWQGERLAYPEREIYFLQQKSGDGSTAVRLEVPAGSDQEAILALLPQMGTPTGDALDADIQFVRARRNDAGEWTFDVTVAHPDTGWADYTDGWHVETPEGEILGTRILLHPHVGEQPFTRSLGRVIVPPDVNEVRIRTHDLVRGYGPAAVALPLEEAGTGDLYEVIR